MQIKISGHGTVVSAALRDYVQSKIVKLEEFFKNIQKVEIILDARSNADAEQRQVVEIRAWMAGKKMVTAKEAGRDMYAAFDLVLNEVKKQVEKHKEKMNHEKVRQAKKLKLVARKKIPGISTSPFPEI